MNIQTEITETPMMIEDVLFGWPEDEEEEDEEEMWSDEEIMSIEQDYYRDIL